VSRRIVERILSAESAQDVLAAQGTLAAKDVLGVPMKVTGVHWMPSDLPGSKVYGVLDAVIRNKRVSVTCGSRTVMVQLWKLNDLGVFPISVQICESPTPTANGFRPMWLEAAVVAEDEPF